MLKNIKTKLFSLLIGSLLLASCYEEDPWLEDSITRTGEAFPVIYMNALEEEYMVGDNVVVDLEFFSEGDLEEIVLYETIGDAERQEVSRTPYAPAFSEIKALDTLALTYSVPEVDAEVTIILEAEAVNANGLTNSSSQDFEAQP